MPPGVTDREQKLVELVYDMASHLLQAHNIMAQIDIDSSWRQAAAQLIVQQVEQAVERAQALGLNLVLHRPVVLTRSDQPAPGD